MSWSWLGVSWGKGIHLRWLVLWVAGQVTAVTGLVAACVGSGQLQVHPFLVVAVGNPCRPTPGRVPAGGVQGLPNPRSLQVLCRARPDVASYQPVTGRALGLVPVVSRALAM